MIGTDTKTNRGFHLVNFTDVRGRECSLQQSSAIRSSNDEDEERAWGQPGSSCIWLGVQDADIKVPFDGDFKALTLPDAVLITDRMHLDRQAVSELIDRLQERNFGQFEDSNGELCNFSEAEGVISLGIIDGRPQILCSQAVEHGQKRIHPNGWQPYVLRDDVVIDVQMYLSAEQVPQLIARLEIWLKTGYFTEEL